MTPGSRATGRRLAVAVLAGVACAFAAAAPVARAQIMRPEHARVGGAVVARVPLVQGETLRGAVLLKVEPGLHVNANPASEDWLIATELGLEGGEGLHLLRAFYPAAQEKEFDFYSGMLKVWEKDVVIGFEIEVTEDTAIGERNLRLTVRYQACNDAACFAPADATFELPVSVARAGSTSRAVQSPLLHKAPFPRSEP